MSNEHDVSNGLTTFTLHSGDDASREALDRLDQERPAYPGLAAGAESDLDPETAARRHLSQALESAALPSLTAPVVGGTTSGFKVISTETVSLTGTRIVKFRQTLHEIPVYGSLVTVELGDDNEMVSIDSSLGHPEGVDPVARVAPSQAIETARTAPDGYEPTVEGVVPRLVYYYDQADSRWRLVYMLEDVPVTLDRTAEPEPDRDSPNEPPHLVDYVIDAHDTSVVAIRPRTPSISPAGQEQTAVDSLGASRTFLASPHNGGLVLRDPVHNVETYDFGFNDPDRRGHQLPGAPVETTSDWPPEAVSAHANAADVSDFMRAALMRSNIDNHGGVMTSSINCVVEAESPGPKQWVNAFWNGQQMVYGQVQRPDGLRSLSANIDVVAHEIFHGVTNATSRLEYVSQSGALNESYSDIFGVIVANRANDDPQSWNWEIGENLLQGDQPFRDVSDPPRFDQPAHMDDFRVLPNTRAGDWGGVHINSGIPNKAAYILLTAQNSDGTLVLTVAETAAVFYLADTQRLSRTSQFSDARRAAVASARTLFRNLPADLQASKVGAVEASFEAVGIL